MGKRNEEEIPRAFRHRLQILGRIIVDEAATPPESYLCNTLNVSLSGALVETGIRMRVGAVLRYSFSLPGAKTPLDVTGEVVRKDEPAGREVPGESVPRWLNCYGIRFIEMTEEVRSALEWHIQGGFSA